MAVGARGRVCRQHRGRYGAAGEARTEVEEMERPVEWEDVLLVRFGSLGDVVLTLPVAEAVRRRLPDARISIAVKESYGSLFRSDGPVDRVFPFSNSGRHGGLAGLQRYARVLAGESFDLVIDLHASLRSRLLTRMLRVPRVVRASPARASRQALVRFKKPILGYPGHVVNRYLAAARSAGIPAVNERLHLRIPRDIREDVAAKVRDRLVPSASRLMVLAPGAGRLTKRWGADRYGALARRLAEEASVDVVITGPADESELVLGVTDAADHRRVCAFMSNDLMEQGALLAAASRVVTNDSGLMHLSAAVGTPVVALFGSTTTSLGFYPLGERDVVIALPLDCRPCGLHGRDRCPRGDLACLDGIPVDRVYDAVCGDAGENG